MGFEIGRIEPLPYSSDDALQKYEASGRIPWSEGYDVAHDSLIAATLDNCALMAAFAAGRNLPGDYGIGIDERCVDFPWVFAKLKDVSGKILDAGSSLNYPFLIDRLLKDDVKLDVLTLTPERHCFADRGVAYLYEDLRKIPIVDGHYDCVVCVSTLEHVGFNNEFFTQRRADVEHRPNDYLIACSEMFRVLRPEGQLLITVPFRKYQDVGAFQQFSDKEIGVLVDSMKGASQINVQYFRLRATGAWDIATADECSQCESVHWVMASKSERPKMFPVQLDKAASARAVACMQIVK